MSKLAKIDAKLLQSVASAVKACWEEGSPVAGQTEDSWQEAARVAIKRIRSFSRRDIPSNDPVAQVRDVAQGLAATFEADQKLLGPLMIDYEYVASKLLEAVRQFETGPT